ncbi:hypothetical protein [Rhizobium subbaraonis]|uniref:hypothetical protein n=1 Tax=Rhizobium subbaraonis TaxID=908946 RepID=UPI000BE4602D|nr:hypothetical protein [Rhizobium subbaraonis]
MQRKAGEEIWPAPFMGGHHDMFCLEAIDARRSRRRQFFRQIPAAVSPCAFPLKLPSSKRKANRHD